MIGSDTHFAERMQTAHKGNKYFPLTQSIKKCGDSIAYNWGSVIEKWVSIIQNSDCTILPSITQHNGVFSIRYFATHRVKVANQFQVMHYAGQVKYL